jgi:hypothetical protein
MASKKYVVRMGFVVCLMLTNAATGAQSERRYEGGEEVTLDDDQAAEHLHKLEYASQRDRDAALAAEREAKVAAAAAQSPVDLVSMLTAALGQALATHAANQAPSA